MEITTFTSARHLSLSWASSIQSIPPHPTSWRSILILSSSLCLGLQSGLAPSGVPCKCPSSPQKCYMPNPSHSSLFYHPNNTGWEVQIIKLLIMYFSPLTCYLIPLRPKYSLQHHILKHPQPTFLSQCERSSFTPIHNNRQNYSIVYLNISIFGLKYILKYQIQIKICAKVNHGMKEICVCKRLLIYCR